MRPDLGMPQCVSINNIYKNIENSYWITGQTYMFLEFCFFVAPGIYSASLKPRSANLVNFTLFCLDSFEFDVFI